MKGEDVNINLKKLVGNWEGYYRIRIGKMRLIFKVHKENKEMFINNSKSQTNQTNQIDRKS